MKQFACGSVVSGCQAIFQAPNETEILAQVAQHAREDHGITEIPDALIAAVRQNIYAVAA